MLDIQSSHLIPSSTLHSAPQASTAEFASTTDSPTRRAVVSPVTVLKRRKETVTRTSVTDVAPSGLATMAPVVRADASVSATIKSSSTTISTQEKGLGKDNMLSKSNGTTPQAEKTNKGPSPRRQFHSVVAGLPLYTFQDSNTARKHSYSRKNKISSQAAERVLLSGATMVGFDLEWKPMRTPKEYNRVSLVQIATETEVLLLQLSGGGRPHEFPPALKTLLESPSVMKVGAGIDGDVEKLARDWGVHVQNYLDLADMARCVDPFWNTCDILRDFSIDGATGIDWSKVDDDYVGQKQGVPDDLLPVDESLHNVAETHSFLPSPPITPPTPQSLPNDPLDRRGTGTIYPRSRSIALARLVARYQGKRLDKGVQLSNWAAPLSKNQIEYAANDGCAGFDVYNSLARLEQASPEWKDRQARHYKSLADAHNLTIITQQLPTPDTEGEGRSIVAPKKPRSTSSLSVDTVDATDRHSSRSSEVLPSDTAQYPSPPMTPVKVRTAPLPSPTQSFRAGRETLPSTVPRLQPAQSFPPVSHHAFHEAASRLNAPQYFSPNSPAQHYHHPISTPYNSPYPHGPDGGMVHQFPSGIWPPENPGFGNQHGWVAPPTFHGPYHHPVDVLPPTAHQPSMWRRASGSLLDNPPIYDHWIGSPYPLPSSSVPNDRWISNFEAVSLKEPPRPTHRTHQSASVTSTTASIGDLFKGPVTPERKRAIRDAITTRHDN